MGITDATMSHGESWHFCRLGRLLERADKTSRILDVKYFILLPSADDVGTPLDDMQWAALLRSASALEMYPQAPRPHRAGRRRGVPDPRSRVSRAPSISACTARANRCTPSPARRSGMFRTGRTAARRAPAPSSSTPGRRDHRGGLHQFLDRLQIKLNEVGKAISETFFAWSARRAVRSKNEWDERQPADSSADGEELGPPMTIRVALIIAPAIATTGPSTFPQVVRLRPRRMPHAHSELLAARQPQRHFINWQQDPHGNYLARLVFPERPAELPVEVDLVAEMTVINPFDFFLEPDAEFSVRLRTSLTGALRPTWPARGRVRGSANFSQRSSRAAPHHRFPGRPQPQSAPGYSLPDPDGARRADPEETLDAGSGSCRDSAGCWCRSCVTWAWPRASSPVI